MSSIAAPASTSGDGPKAFWHMHDLLFEHQGALTYNDLGRYAATVGAEGEVVLNDLDEARYRESVRESFMSGVRSGVNGTPALFIDRVRYDGPRDEETLVAALMLLVDSGAGKKATGNGAPHILELDSALEYR